MKTLLKSLFSLYNRSSYLLPGNSKLIFVLPALSPGMMNNKRKRNENDLLAEADDGAADCSSPNPDPQEELAQEQGTSTTARMSYKEMIDSAFDSYELDLDEEGSVLQTELVDWIASKYYKLQDDSETKKQSLRKGLYSILMKHYERIGSEESTKRQKRGTIRWRTKQGIDSNV